MRTAAAELRLRLPSVFNANGLGWTLRINRSLSILRRLEQTFGKGAIHTISIDGIPRDMASAAALAHKEDDRLRKEFEKWAVLTYTNNRAIINEKKGADAGIDALGLFSKPAR